MIRAALLAAVLSGCTAAPSAAAAPSATAGRAADAAAPRPPARSDAGTTPVGAAAASSWRTAYDWDGDGVNDEVVTRFTGGAHCCYLVGVKLAAASKAIMLPFRLEGGLVPPEDLPSRPERFSVVTTDGGLPEMVMEIETYNGKPGPLDPSWKRVYGISTHRIGVSFRGRKARARDVAPPPSSQHRR